MDYQKSLSAMQELSKFGINLGLGRIGELLRRLRNPQQQLSFIHIAGTNGKGSVGAMASSILTAGGKKTGFFSSPHLDSYCERFRLDGEDIKEEEFAALVNGILGHIKDMQKKGFESPTEFEVCTALALLYYAQNKADWVVLEAGMGGAIDSTNIVDARIAVLTNVDFDHMKYLGDTIEDIARVKSGIIKKGARVFTGAQGVALDVIKQKAKQEGASLSVLGQEIDYCAVQDSLEGQLLRIVTPHASYDDLYLPLLGAHQRSNAALAVAAAEAAGADEGAIRRGLANAFWPARLELIKGKRQVLIDGAHNPHGMTALAEALKHYWPQKRILGIIGMLSDKDKRKALETVLPYMDELIFTSPPAERAGDCRELEDIALQAGHAALVEEDMKKAFLLGWNMAGPDDLIVVCGSLYLAGPARIWFLAKEEE